MLLLHPFTDIAIDCCSTIAERVEKYWMLVESHLKQQIHNISSQGVNLLLVQNSGRYNIGWSNATNCRTSKSNIKNIQMHFLKITSTTKFNISTLITWKITNLNKKKNNVNINHRIIYSRYHLLKSLLYQSIFLLLKSDGNACLCSILHYNIGLSDFFHKKRKKGRLIFSHKKKKENLFDTN